MIHPATRGIRPAATGLPGLSETFHACLIPAAESGQRSGQALPAAAVMPVASPFDRRVIWVGGIVFAGRWRCRRGMALTATSLFLDGARHLQASYVDQPVLGPLLAWVSLKLFGVSLPGLRCGPRSRRGHGGGRRADRP